jgi:hypothetical protein
MYMKVEVEVGGRVLDVDTSVRERLRTACVRSSLLGEAVATSLPLVLLCKAAS